MELKDKIHLLTGLPAFRNLNSLSLQALATIAKFQEAKKGVTIIDENNAGNDVYIILEGRVQIDLTIPDSTKREIIAELKRGEIIGELSLLGKTRRTASAVIKDDCKFLIWNKQALLELYEKNHHIGFLMMSEIAKTLADRLYNTNIALRSAVANRHQ